MAGDEFKIEDRFSRSRGLFPYVLGLIGVAVLIVIMMIVTGIGVEHLPYSEFLVARAPEAADGSEALSLQSLKHVTDEKTTLTVEGTVMNRIGKGVDDAEITAMAAYFAGQRGVAPRRQ